MAFGFPAYHTEEIEKTVSSVGLREAVKQAVGSLGWSICNESATAITAATSVNVSSWGEQVVVQFHPDGRASVTSRCTLVTQCLDWGKNKTNVRALISAVEVTPPRHLPKTNSAKMAITTECPQCGKRLSASESSVGKTLKCPHCMEPILVASPKPAVVAMPSDRRKTCPFCGELIAESAIKCRFCSSMLVPLDGAMGHSHSSHGAKLVHPSDPPKDPILMALLSGCCIAGLGQMVLGQVVKGVVVLIAAMALGAITMGVSIFVTWPLMGIDAYLIARKLKSGRPVTEWESFPSG